MKRGTAKLRQALRDRKFVRAYLTGPDGVRGNAARSAQAAGSKATSTVSLQVQGAKVLAKPNVQRLIQRALDRYNVETERLVGELVAVALTPLRDIVEWDKNGVKVKDSRLLTDAEAAAIQEVEQEETRYGRRVRVRLHDKLRAIEILARIKKAIGDDVPREFTLVIGRADRVAVAVAAASPGDGGPKPSEDRTPDADA